MYHWANVLLNEAYNEKKKEKLYHQSFNQENYFNVDYGYFTTYLYTELMPTMTTL